MNLLSILSKIKIFTERSLTPRFFFSTKEKREIVQAIINAEKNTSGEIHVHLIKKIKKIKNPALNLMAESKVIFEKLNMTQTKERNGVLIVLAVATKEICILGDRGIHEKVSVDFWNDVLAIIADDFKQNKMADGLVKGITRIGEKLINFFPHQLNDRNELSDQITFS